MYRVYLVFLLLVLGGCRCFKKDACRSPSSGIDDKVYNECREKLGHDGVLRDKDGRVLIADRTFFAYDRSDLSSSSKTTLSGQADWMSSHPEAKVTITGHCDERGTREYNIGLGERRAAAARDFLITKNIAPDRMTVLSKGKDEPIVLGSTEEAWAQNRVAILSPVS